MAPRKQAPVFQFKIILEGTSPPVWRRIQIPADCTFWDLHVAIQDAMGWLDYHLHLFTVQHPVKGVGEIGIPSDEDDGFGRPVLPGWKENVSGWLTPEHNSADYEYDFGDGWRHQVIFEKALPREKGAKYPRCIDGKRACPPEDCGGIPGYQQICRGKSEFQDQFADYDPDAFDPGKVRFDDPKKRFKTMMSHDEGP